MTLKHWYQILVGKFLHWISHPRLEDMENIQREMCKIKGNFMSLIFDRKNVIDLSEWLHESYLKNNEDIHNLKFKMNNFFRGCKILVLPPMFQIFIW